MTDRKVHIVSLGCPKNLVDSERMLGLLGSNDYEITNDEADADVVIVNTCGFIGPAKEESIDAIMAAQELRRRGGKCKGVIVTGCLAQRYETELESELPEADRILTLDREMQIVQHVDELLEIGRATDQLVECAPRQTLTPKHWTYLRISDGCDHKCAFCAIPLIKGRHKSESTDALVDEAERLAAMGARELVLIAQDSLRYGKDLYGKISLVPLLEKLSAVQGIDWLRLMYTYPAFWSEELLEFYASSDTMCHYVDMPLQHISDPVLVRMKRATTKKRTIELLARLRQLMPDVGLRSSFIVGFPGESEAQFEELLGFVQSTRFDTATCFMYSHEEGTSAHDLAETADETVKAERFRRLTELQDQISTEINDALVGSRQTALVDSRDGIGFWGRMARDAPDIDGQVHIQPPAGESTLTVGSFAEVEITGAASYELSGRATGRVW